MTTEEALKFIAGRSTDDVLREFVAHDKHADPVIVALVARADKKAARREARKVTE